MSPYGPPPQYHALDMLYYPINENSEDLYIIAKLKGDSQESFPQENHVNIWRDGLRSKRIAHFMKLIIRKLDNYGRDQNGHYIGDYILKIIKQSDGRSDIINDLIAEGFDSDIINISVAGSMLSSALSEEPDKLQSVIDEINPSHDLVRDVVHYHRKAGPRIKNKLISVLRDNGYNV